MGFFAAKPIFLKEAALAGMPFSLGDDRLSSTYRRGLQMAGRQRWQQLKGLAAPQTKKSIISLSVVLAYLLSMLVLIGVPPSLFLSVTRSAGSNINDNLHLSSLGRCLLYGVFAFTFAWSIVVGGFAKTFLKPRHLGWPWLIVFGLGLLFGLTVLFDQAREVIGALHIEVGNDNDKVVAFFAFWLLMIGYAAKAVWDEARDRMAGVFERHVNHAEPASRAIISHSEPSLAAKE